LEAVSEESTNQEPAAEAVEPESSPMPTKTKVQLWNEIKILCEYHSTPFHGPLWSVTNPRLRIAFTRLLTSIYVLSLLTLQTHVQLALLGRAHYVKSLIDSLPPRSPSPTEPSTFTSSDEKGKGKEEPTTMSEEDDLEAALYKAKELPTREEDRVSEDVERKYLTFSWWLLHEGWKVVRDRVEEKVDELVGP
jgi:hypothetical protein